MFKKETYWELFLEQKTEIIQKTLRTCNRKKNIILNLK